MKKSPKTILLIIALIIIVLIVFRLIYSDSHTHTHNRNTVSTVITAQATLKPAPLFIKTQGQIDTSQSVTIQPQISGIIKTIGFTPGHRVTAGQLLFQLDSTTYEANLEIAKANLAKDQAQLIITQNNALRYQSLLKTGYASPQDYEQFKAQWDAQLNIVKSDQATVKQMQAELDYTHIIAPFSGKTGNVTVKTGDLVQPSGSQPLVTINQLQPVFVNFYLSQQYLTSLMFYQKKHPLTVMVYSEDKKQLLDTGELTFIDNAVNPDSGSVLVKATLPNKNSLLWPGETVSVKLILTVEPNVIAIPTQAVQTSQNGQFVYVIVNNHALITPITVLRQIGSWTFVSKGLKDGDAVATVFPPDLNNQSPVHVVSAASQQESV